MTRSAENLQHLLKEVDERKKELDALRPMRREDEERLWKKLRLEWNYNSNHIEGNTLTYQETKSLLFKELSPDNTRTMREIDEMRAHDLAIEVIKNLAADATRELSQVDIRNLNKIILVKPFWKEAITPDGQSVRRLITVGEYKKHPNSVRLQTGEIFDYTAPEEVQHEMDDLMEWYRKTSPEFHSLVVSALLHYRFVRIHPFDDGNGRVARLLMNYHLLRNDFPPVVIKSADKKNYLIALQRADEDDFEAFAAYIAEQLLWSLDLNIKAAERKNLEEQGDWEKELAILEKTLKKDDEVQPASNELIYKRVNDSLIPLYQKVSEKVIARIGKFYAALEERLQFRFSNQYFEIQPAEISSAVQGYFNDRKLKDVQEFAIHLYWKGLKTNPTDANNVGISINVRFSQFQYEINFSGPSNMLLAKKYTIPVSSSEQEKIVDSIGKFLVEKIRNASAEIPEA